MLCRESKDFLPKIADVLSQLLQTQDPSELVVIQNSLMSLFRKEAKGSKCKLIKYNLSHEDPLNYYKQPQFEQVDTLISGTMIGLFSQIRTGGDIVRGRAIKFLLVKIKTEGTDLLNKETESHLLEEIKLCMGEVSKIYQCV